MEIINDVNLLVLEKFEEPINGCFHLSVSDGERKRFFCCQVKNEGYRNAAVRMITTTPDMTFKQAVDMALFVEMWRTERCSEYMDKTACEIEELLRFQMSQIKEDFHE